MKRGGIVGVLVGISATAGVFGGASPGLAATETSVDCGAGADLQAAIDAAAPGAILDISGRCVGTFVVGKHLVLKGVSDAVLDVQGEGSALTIIGGTVRVTKLRLTGGTDPGVVNHGTLVMQRSTVIGFEADGSDAGGIDNFGTATVQQSTINRNSETGITNWRSASLTVIASTVNGNSSGPMGGGITNFGAAMIIRSTIANNQSWNAEGGGIENWGTMSITHSTITGNDGDAEGGGLQNYGTTIITATIIAGNVASGGVGFSDCAGPGPVVSHGYNLVGTIKEQDPCPFQLVSSDRAGTSTRINANLLPLGSYGGPTQTAKPRAISRAVDAIPIGAASTDATPLCPASGTFDQRGKPRPNGPACDIGAVER